MSGHIRTGTVDVLVTEVLNAIATVEHTDPEAMSAMFILTLRVIDVVKARMPEYLPTLQAACESLLLACANESVKN